MKTFARHIYVLLFSFYFSTTHAQYNYFNNFTEEDGLTHNKVNAILQDQYGFIWIGTTLGLNRYDGYGFTPFYHNPEDSLSISSNEISVMHEDSKGRLWIGTTNSYLNLYDRSTNNFIRFTLPRMEDISAIQEREDGRLWIATRNYGLFIFDPDKPESYEQIWPYEGDEKQRKTNDHIYSFKVGEKGDVWIGSDIGVDIYPFSSEKLLFESSFNELIDLSMPEEYFISALYQTKDGRTWIGTPKGLFVWDPLAPKEKLHRILPAKALTQKGSADIHDLSNFILKIVEDKEGNLWLGTQTGLAFYNVIENRFTFYKPNHNYRNALSGGGCWALLIDRSGMLWVGTDNGISTLHPNTLKFNLDEGQKLIPPGLNPRNIREIDKVSDHYFLSTTEGLFMAWKMDQHFQFKCLNKNDFTCLYYNKKNTVYAGTVALTDFYQFNTEKKVFSSLGKTREFSNPLKMRGNSIRDFTEDYLGKVWIATLGSLNRYDPDTQKFNHFQGDKDGIINLSNTNALLSDRHNNLWIATNTGLGLLTCSELEQFSSTELPLKLSSKIPNNKQSLSSNIVQTILEAANGNIWLGTNTGLHQAHFDGDSIYIERHYLIKDGPEPSIVDILEDDRGNLWISTSNAGLFRYTPFTKSAWNISAKDGLLSNSFQTDFFPYKNALKEQDGKMLFLTGKGFINFYPDSLQKNEMPPPLYFTDFNVSDRRETELKKELLFHPLANNENLIVRPDQNMIHIQFAALNLLNPEKTTYAYRLQGFSDSLIQLGNRREITFVNLPPKTYQLEIVAWNNDGIKTQEPLQLSLIIRPHFYQTHLAYLFYSLLIVCLLYGIFQYQLNRKNTLQLEKLNVLKNRFITNISHELKTPLTIIIGQTSQILKKSDALSKSDIRSKVEVVKNHGEQLKKLTQQLLDLRELDIGLKTLKNQNGDIMSFLKKLTILHHSLADEKNIQLSFEATPEKMLVAFDPDLLHPVFTNLLTNAIKFTFAGGMIHVRLKQVIEQGNNQIKISISDNGIGIAQEDLKHIFEVFYRAEKAEQDQIPGTGVGLALVWEIVDLLKGRIQVDSSPNKGSTFTVFLPLSSPFEEQAEPQSLPDFNPNKNTEPETPLVSTDKKTALQGKKPLILIIEDHLEMQQYLSDCLEGYYHTTSASDGDKGITMASDLNPDLIICDVMMPEKSGIEVCQQLKNQESTKHIPIVILTAKADLQTEKEGIKSGADLYLAKPFDEEQLLLWIENQLQARQELQKTFSSPTWIAKSLIQIDHLPAKDHRFLEELLNLIQTNIQNSNLKVPDLATAMNYSERSLQRDFHALTGQSIMAYILNLRIQLAKKLLISTSLTIEQVSIETGYSNLASFSRAFKNQEGLSPKGFRKREG